MTFDQEYKLAIRLSGVKHAIRENSNKPRLCAALHRQAQSIRRELREA